MRRGINPFQNIHFKLASFFVIAYFIVIGAFVYVVLYGAPWNSDVGFVGTLYAEKIHSLKLSADLCERRLVDYLRQQRDELTFFCEFSTLATVIAEWRSENATADSTMVKNSPKRLTRESAFQVMSRTIKALADHYQAKAVWLVDCQKGTIIASSSPLAHTERITSHPFFTKVIQVRGGEISGLLLLPGETPSVILIGSELNVYENSKLNGKSGRYAVILVYDVEKLLHRILNVGWELGAGGEVVIVNQDGVLLNNLGLKVGGCEMSARMAASGNEGVIEAKDSRGVDILAVFRHIRLGEEKGWGIVVKVDRNEFFRDLDRCVLSFIQVGIAGFFLLTSVSLAIIGGFSRVVDPSMTRQNQRDTELELAPAGASARNHDRSDNAESHGESESEKSVATVLLIDDEEMIRDTITDMLEDNGYKVVSAENGEAGLEYYRKNWKTTDIVILDMIMPKMNGFETYKGMKEINSNVKVVVISGFCKEEDIDSLKQDGVKYFISKPFREQELMAKIEDILSE